jgi:hypothetical protein
MSVKGIMNVEKYAKNNGLRIVLPEPRQLQLDIDSTTLPEDYPEQLYILGQQNKILNVRQTTSKSGNLHVYIDLDLDISPVERVLFQLALGSDRKRELLTFFNLSDPENQRPQFLFEKGSPA